MSMWVSVVSFTVVDRVSVLSSLLPLVGLIRLTYRQSKSNGATSPQCLRPAVCPQCLLAVYAVHDNDLGHGCHREDREGHWVCQ